MIVTVNTGRTAVTGLLPSLFTPTTTFSVVTVDVNSTGTNGACVGDMR
jgi:hypothetical protein